MAIFDVLEAQGDHEEVIICNNRDVGLKAIIAIHNTALGPALGGTRMWTYGSDEEALIDVLRLSKGMTYKAAAAGLNLGGGKAVIIGDYKKHKTEGLFRAFGQYVNSLNGRYITAEDVGTTVKDMEYVYMETPWVTGIAKSLGGSGDPSPFTAHGVLMGIKAAADYKLKSDLKGVRIAVQGLGNVGRNLVRYLVKEGAKVTVADIDQDRVRQVVDEFGVQYSNPDEILYTECDILAPCALGAVVNDESIPKFNCPIIAGGANNQLADESHHADALREAGILYAPDYVINAGGLMNVFVELEGYSIDRAKDHTLRIYDTLTNVFKIADEENISTKTAADRMAQRRIDNIGRLRQRHTGKAQRPFNTLKVDDR